MTIQLPDVGTGVPADQTGDSPWLAMKKVRENFSDQSNAASRLVGTATGNVMEVGAFGLGSYAKLYSTDTTMADHIAKMGAKTEFIYSITPAASGTKPFEDYSMGFATNLSGDVVILGLGMNGTKCGYIAKSSTGNIANVTFWTDKNATKDPNGFLKGASPIAEIYSDKMDLNQDATEQGGITYEKLGVGDYLVKGSLGFAQEGWYIETPKDANGNVLVAVVYEQLANNDLSIKTYAKRFDEETGDIVPNLARPRDIPVGRFISLRLHELPKEPPVMPTATQTEV